MTAKEARLMTNGHPQEFNEALHNEIIEKIKAKAREPKDNTLLTIPLPPLGNINKIVELGYNILEINLEGSFELIISWEKPQMPHFPKYTWIKGQQIGIPLASY